MYFGFLNASATFQVMINDILGDLIWEEHVIIYLDDILIFIDNICKHQEITQEMLKRLQDNNLFAKPEKCFFDRVALST